MLRHIDRLNLQKRLHQSTSQYPVTLVLGARQTGKTELCRAFASSPDHYFDLERTTDAVRLTDNAQSVLGALAGCVIIDEAQELPELFSTLRVLADRPEKPARFIVTGSVSPTLLTAVSESLAGRASIIEIGGLDLSEVEPDHWKKLWLRGGHPPSFLAPSDAQAYEWRENYLSLLIGRDLRIWSRSDLKPAQVRKLLEIVADSCGQAWNHSAAANVLDLSYKTIQSYVETLKGAYLIRELQPFETNIRKRIRRSPTLLLRDTGIMHNLLRIRSASHLESHPRRGFSWEAFCTDQIIRLAALREENCFRWSVQGGAEVDLVIELPGRRIGAEFKTSDAPKLTESMRSGRDVLGLNKLFVIFPGDVRFAMDEKIEAVGISRLPELCGEISQV
ncbi:ATP-binding protein [soil metagenome]